MPQIKTRPFVTPVPATVILPECKCLTQHPDLICEACEIEDALDPSLTDCLVADVRYI